MEAPMHKLCGTRHWSKEPCPLDAKATKAARIDLADKVIKSKATPKPARKKSTAARKDVRADRPRGRSGAKGQPREVGVDVAQMVETPVQPEVAGSSPAISAGTQAPPVDTQKKRGRPRLANPKSKRAEYQRELMRKRYAEKRGKTDA